MVVWSKNRLHFGTISEKSSTSSKNVSTGILVSDKGGGIYVEEGNHPKNISEKISILEQPVINLKNLNAFIPYLHFKMTGVHLLNDMLKEKDYMCKIHLKDAYFCVHCIKNIRSTSGFVGKVNYLNSFVYVLARGHLHKFLQSS